MYGKQRCRGVNPPVHFSDTQSLTARIDWGRMDMDYSTVKNTMNATGKLG